MPAAATVVSRALCANVGPRTGSARDAGGRYEIALPVDRQGAFARSPGRLVAIDADGAELASRTVEAVSFWHSNEGAG
jgi:hypothetical protein